MYQTSREKKALWGMSTVTVTMCHDKFPESVQITVHVLQSQQQVGPFWKQSKASMKEENSSAMSSTYKDKQTWVSPSVKTSPRRGGKQKDHSGEKECIRLGWTGVVWMETGYIRSPIQSPCLNSRVTVCSNWAVTLLQRDHDQHQPRQPLGNVEVFDWMKKGVEQIIKDSDLVLAFSHLVSFIQTSYPDEQCITQKYKGKILVLHYTFSKIYTE